MPLLVAEIRQIEGAIEKIENWAEPVPRRPAVPQPVIHADRRQSSPRKNKQQPRDNTSKKLNQRFDFHFKSLLRIVDGQAEMDSATTDQAESMYKTIENMRQNLDKYDDNDMENIIIDRRPYNINETKASWIRKICISKDKKRKERQAGPSSA